MAEEQKQQPEAEAQQQEEREVESFAELGIVDSLVAATAALNWTKPTQIQAKAIPYALQVRRRRAGPR